MHVEPGAIAYCCKPKGLVVCYIDPGPCKWNLGIQQMCWWSKDMLLFTKRWMSERGRRKGGKLKEVTTADPKMSWGSVLLFLECWGCDGLSAAGCGFGSAFYALWWSPPTGSGAVARQRLSSILCCACAALSVHFPLHGCGQAGWKSGEGQETALSKMANSLLLLCSCTRVFVLYHSIECYCTIFFVLRPSQD